ncbi:MAG TPA: DNA polymerase III subunit gamma/tau [Candidatus Paceibacterota bacterium]|nr:DNA polymerase III subunit gamma/tau [Candidatus Paceibacterota bacterium]
MAKTLTEEIRAPLALYRAYRPSSFGDVRGQEEVVSVLEAALKKGDIAHAYLFSGGRGTGKTSMARIFARALGTADEDIYEMDAASNRQVDDARALREGVATLPFSSKYKVYILDEVHMFTKESWNTLLKTLEEPPAHAIFILATTELDRVPETIQSRCQVFRFKKPSHDILKKLVLDVAKKEGIVLEPAGAELIALMGDGSFRDTLGTLQKVLTVSDDKKLSEAEVAKVVGAPASGVVNDFLSGLAHGSAEDALAAFHTALRAGAEPELFAMLAAARVRAVLLLRFAPKLRQELAEQFGPDDLALIEKFAGKEGAGINAAALAELLTAIIDTPRAPVPALPLELALFRMFKQ